jgi:hypothetical protein
MLARLIKRWDFRTAAKWYMLPMAIVLALFLPPFLLSFILTFVLTIVLNSLHPYSYALSGRTLSGCHTAIRPRSPPIS